MRRPSLWILWLAISAAAFSIRFLALAGLPNDHYVYLAGAQQMLTGEWPARDFDDPGVTLMYAASAGAQLLFGRTLLAEAVLVSAAFAVAAAITAAAVASLTGSIVLALTAAFLEVAIFPRSYGYPKLLLYAAGVALLWRFVRQPSTSRLLAIAAATAVAFAVRHDHGVFLGLAGLLTVFLASPAGWRLQARRCAEYLAITLVCLLPYLGFLSVSGGVVEHVRSAVTFNQAEAERTDAARPAFDVGADVAANAVPWLFYTAWLLPLVALAVLATTRRQQAATVAMVAPVCLLALLVNWFFLREPLRARLPDVIVPAVFIGAWLASLAWASHRRAAKAIASAAVIVVTVVSGIAIVSIGEGVEQLDRMGVFNGVSLLPARYAERTRELRERFAPRQIPSPTIVALRPIFDYIDRCTTSDQRLLVPGFAPEIPVYARRLFAGGQSTYRYPATRTEHRRIWDRLQRQVIPLALVASDWDATARRLYPELDLFMVDRFVPIADVLVNDARTVHVLVNRTLTPVREDSPTGWPCFT